MGTCSVPTNIQSPELRRLGPQLLDVQQSAQARDALAKASANDANVMADLNNAVPFWIASCPSDVVWVNVVRLAENLKLSAAIPALVQALDRRYRETPLVTATTAQRLDYDTVARALIAIGDPAIPALSKRWSQERDAAQRSRIAVILANIGTPAASNTLQQQLANEKDPEVRRVINLQLRYIQNGSH